MNHLEQLTAEWYEFRGYFVRRNVQVGKRLKGGYECELDVVAFCPQGKHLVHIEPSMDAHTWDKREERYKKKFAAGFQYIPSLFEGLNLPTEIEQIALLGIKGSANLIFYDLKRELEFFIFTLNLKTPRSYYEKSRVLFTSHSNCLSYCQSMGL